MAVVTYDDRSLLLDGNRLWLTSGTVDYFRTPSALWRDRLLKARRCGLNCVSTYVAWNMHEPAEGRWEASGDNDLLAFVRLAGEFRLYVILRPGPFIGTDLDGGGLPGWLGAKSGISFRTSNAAYTHYYDKYIRRVLPRLADHQVTRGGNIVLIQNENDYFQTTMPDRQSYLDFINQLFRRSGFEIPIITCNGMSEPAVNDTIETVSADSDAVQQLKRLRVRSPRTPMIVSALASGPAGRWGRQTAPAEPRQTARRAMEILGCGAQVNYEPWAGGTNFGFWGGRCATDDACYAATSHDCGAPLSEGGLLTEKYYLTRLVNMLSTHMGGFLATCAMEGPGATIHDGASVLNISGPRGRWAFITSGGRADVQSVQMSLADGTDLSVPLEPLGAAAIPSGLQLTTSARLDYSNVTPLGIFGERIIVFHGPAGWPAVVCINGQKIEAPIPAGEEPAVVESHGLLVVLVNSSLAGRTWLVDENVIFGPAFMGAEADDLTPSGKAKDYATISLEGAPGRLKAPAGGEKPPKPAEIALGSWKRQAVCVEPVGQVDWRPIDGPRDVDQLGAHYGYVWYRVTFDEARGQRRHLVLPQCEDRATIFLNGHLLGIWGRGDGANRSPISVATHKGENVLTMLVDNLGRFCQEPCLGDRKGVFGHVYDASPLAPKAVLKADEEFARRLIPRQLSYLTAELEAAKMWAIDMTVPLTRVSPVHMEFRNLPHHAALMCNGRLVKFFPMARGGVNFGDVILGPELKKGKNLLRVLLWGDVKPEAVKAFQFDLLAENLTQAGKWGWLPWELPKEGAHVVGKNQPAWYVTHFNRPSQAGAVFVHLTGVRKGQLFINGHNVGRFWAVGPQRRYFLPECWLKEQNELQLFEESGLIPAKSSLEVIPAIGGAV